jgi:hypothetical protein
MRKKLKNRNIISKFFAFGGNLMRKYDAQGISGSECIKMHEFYLHFKKFFRPSDPLPPGGTCTSTSSPPPFKDVPISALGPGSPQGPRFIVRVTCTMSS